LRNADAGNSSRTRYRSQPAGLANARRAPQLLAVAIAAILRSARTADLERSAPSTIPQYYQTHVPE
jgi:hypothetical protein